MSTKRDEIEAALRAFINKRDWSTKINGYSWTMAHDLYDAIKDIVEAPSEEEAKSNTVVIGGKTYIKGPKEVLKK